MHEMSQLSNTAGSCHCNADLCRECSKCSQDFHVHPPINHKSAPEKVGRNWNHSWSAQTRCCAWHLSTPADENRIRLSHLRNRFKIASQTAREITGRNNLRICVQTVQNQLSEWTHYICIVRLKFAGSFLIVHWTVNEQSFVNFDLGMDCLISQNSCIPNTLFWLSYKIVSLHYIAMRFLFCSVRIYTLNSKSSEY